MDETQAVEAPAPDAQVTDVEPAESTEWAPLFESEKEVSESDLMGDAGSDDEPAEPAEKAEGDKPKDEPKAEQKVEARPEPAKPEKPPEGYVPYEALNEERGKRQRLAQENAALQQELVQLRDTATKPVKEDPWKEFKVLDRAELEELWEEDPAKATMYAAELPRYFEARREKAAAEEAAKRAENQHRGVIESGYQAIDKAVPGILENKDLSARLSEFAISKGFSDATLEALTNPATKVILPNGQSFILGPAAGEVVGLVAGFHGAATADEAQLKARFEAELRPKIEKEITQKLMSKFKTGSDFRSLDMAAGSSGKAPVSKHRVSESEYARMSPAEQEKYLMGEDGP